MYHQPIPFKFRTLRKKSKLEPKQSEWAEDKSVSNKIRLLFDFILNSDDSENSSINIYEDIIEINLTHNSKYVSVNIIRDKGFMVRLDDKQIKFCDRYLHQEYYNPFLEKNTKNNIKTFNEIWKTFDKSLNRLYIKNELEKNL